MNALILGGNSPRHKEWVRQVAEVLRPQFEQVRYIDYRQWDQGGDTDIEYEVLQAAEAAKKLGEPYVVVAKSIGTVITTLAVARGLLAPEKSVLLGVPLGLAESVSEFTLALAALPTTIVVQNKYDPYGSYSQIKTFLAPHANAQTSFTMVPGDTHDYVDFGQIRDLAKV